MERAEAYKKYLGHRANAKSRGIGWEFDFDGWLSVWESSGRLDQRGKGVDKYVMSRPGDVGPYSPTNVRIITFSENIREARAVRFLGSDNPSAVQAMCEKEAFFVKHGITVLDWLKDAIDWHFKVAPLKLQSRATWPEFMEDKEAA